MKAHGRRARARALLERLGIGDRSHHRPSELSGGQQQRTSIARALMNVGEIILADEPAGLLDTRSGEELMRLLATLNAQGHTVVVVTHDPEVAAHAGRIVEIRDGRIVSDPDRTAPGKTASVPPQPASVAITAPSGVGSRSLRDRLIEAFKMAVMAMVAHKLWTFLTMLGFIIGIASVTTVVALATGAKGSILDQISSLGASLALLASVVFNALFDNFKMNISMLSLAGAFACSTLVGVVFSFLPARNAARMHPVEALARE